MKDVKQDLQALSRPPFLKGCYQQLTKCYTNNQKKHFLQSSCNLLIPTTSSISIYLFLQNVCSEFNIYI